MTLLHDSSPVNLAHWQFVSVDAALHVSLVALSEPKLNTEDFVTQPVVLSMFNQGLFKRFQQPLRQLV
jgi:hypothetical protein